MSLAAFAASFGFLASQYLANAASSGAAVCGGWIVPSTAVIATSPTPARIGAFSPGSGLQTDVSRCQVRVPGTRRGRPGTAKGRFADLTPDARQRPGTRNGRFTDLTPGAARTPRSSCRSEEHTSDSS